VIFAEGVRIGDILGCLLQELSERNVPEIQRSHLAASILQLKATGIDNVMTFPWLDVPPAEAAVRGLEQLFALGALNEDAKCAPGLIC
jgi:HrpA-like RNA helicase